MRKTLHGLAGFAALAVAQFMTAGALVAQEPYPWCAVYGGGREGVAASNCGFVSLEQCRATVRGMGGFCEMNPVYPGSTPIPHRYHRG